MNTYLALLRGINVGGNAPVDMKQLKACFEALDFINVRTYINTGNVIFDSPMKNRTVLIESIETKLNESFGFKIPIVLRDKENLKTLCDTFPKTWINNDEYKTDILFLWDAYDTEDSINLITHNPKVDILIYVSGSIGWCIRRDHYRESGMSKFIGSPLYKNMTARNINTLRKLNALMWNEKSS
jgi:uncharacterized protein (DUF1697 family)